VAVRIGSGGRSGVPGERPVGAENLCHLVIFMNHASGAVTPLKPEMIQVGDAIG
jgi:hypothetical protein